MTYPVGLTSSAERSRRALLTHAHRELHELAERMGARDESSYVTVLRLIGALIEDGSATPQISSNGDGGIFVEWLAGGLSLTIDFEDETEILIVGSSDMLGVQFDRTVTAWWTTSNEAILTARSFLASISSRVAQPLPLS